MAYVTDEMVVKRANAAVKLALEKNRALDIPSIVYDSKEKMIYELHSDGSRVAVGRPLKETRYGD